eukprot:scaffold464_cov181-Amphora_coffeaeformis.AAC.29
MDPQQHHAKSSGLALEQCRLGLAMLQSGHLFPSVKQMRAALETLREELDGGAGDQQRSESSPSPAILSIPISQNLVSNHKSVSPSNEFSICLRAFNVNSDRRNDNDLVASILMYNFAFAMHVYGLSTGQSRHLQRALILYKKTKSLVEAKQGEARYSHLALALWTNMGHLASHFFFHEEVRYCQHNLRRIIAEFANPYISECDLMFFSGMLLRDLGCSCKTAAAA